MTEARPEIWKTLFRRALDILDSAACMGLPDGDWSFGGGTVLMLKHRHRYSKDIDIFVPDPQYLGFLTPRLNDIAERDITDYIEQSGSVKIYYPEGEIDFVAAPPLTQVPFFQEQVLDRRVNVETSLEIVGKKIRFRATDFKARDIFDLALVLEREPETVPGLTPFLRERREILLARLGKSDTILRTDFAAIDTLDYRPSYDDCIERIRTVLAGIEDLPQSK